MSHPRIEEVSDSDPELDSDPDIDDIDTFMPSHPAAAAAAPQKPNPTLTPSQQIPVQAQAQAPRAPQFDASIAKRWICLYPVYFDASRSRHQGRRVGKELAVENPLARTIADAGAHLGLRVFIDVGKTHPKDWANSGRVKVELRGEDGELKRTGIKNSMVYEHCG